MDIEIHLYSQSQPISIKSAKNAYQKGDLYCIMSEDGKTVWKFPLQHIFRIVEK